METTVTIKGMDKETWQVFKADAVREGKTTAEHFEELVEQHCRGINLTESLKIMDGLRKKAGKWSGSKEITKWREKRVF